MASTAGQSLIVAFKEARWKAGVQRRARERSPVMWGWVREQAGLCPLLEVFRGPSHRMLETAVASEGQTQSAIPRKEAR